MSDRVENKGEPNGDEMARMLAWFRTTLPEHELDEWHVWLRPHEITMTDQRPHTMQSARAGLGYAAAMCRCLRCGRTWSTGDENVRAGWLWVRDSSRETYGNVIEAAKDTLRKRAEGDPCWGDVPKIPRTPEGAVFDAGRAVLAEEGEGDEAHSLEEKDEQS